MSALQREPEDTDFSAELVDLIVLGDLLLLLLLAIKLLLVRDPKHGQSPAQQSLLEI